jgi:hypothetical protein
MPGWKRPITFPPREGKDAFPTYTFRKRYSKAAYRAGPESTRRKKNPANRRGFPRSLRVLSLAYELHVHCLQALWSAFDPKRHRLTLSQGTKAISVDSREVHEYVFSSVLGCNKAKALGLIEPLYSTSLHQQQSSIEMYHCVLHADHERELAGDTWEGLPKQPTFKNCTFNNIIAHYHGSARKNRCFFDRDSSGLRNCLKSVASAG